MAYKLMSNGVRRLSDGAFIPQDHDNADWQNYEKWLLEGNSPEPKDVDFNDTPLGKITLIESANPITHRALRELVLAIGAVYPAAQSAPFYQRAKAADDLIKAERAKL